MPKDTLTGRIVLLEQIVQGLLTREAKQPSSPTVTDDLLKRIATALEKTSEWDRDRIAAQVMSGMLSGVDLGRFTSGVGFDFAVLAKVAYDAADALIKERELRRAKYSYYGAHQAEHQPKG
jgi:hypothetical protein